jgi:signal transduction histidine kinase
VRRELLALALRAAGKTVPLLVVAGWFVAWMGLEAGASNFAVATALLTAITAGWRFLMAYRYGGTELSLPMIRRIEFELRGNALLAGATWAIATVGIYPLLDAHSANAHLVILVGSAGVAVHFLTLVRWSYALLVIPSIGSLAAVSLLVGPVRSIPMAVLAIIYAATLLRTGGQSRETAARAIQHGLEVDEVNESLRRAKEDAEAGAIAKSQFLATMSHEIRTPMNGVLGSLELLRRSPLSDEQRRLVRTAGASGETLMAILNDVLDHSKIEAGKLTLKSEPMSLHNLAASVIGLFRPNADAKGLALRLRVDLDVPDWVYGDSQRLKQVLLNLVSNAIKFTQYGSVHLYVRTAETRGEAPCVLFEVHDTGVGIAAQEIKRLFMPFMQLEQEGSSGRRGTGLGLAISQRIVEAMGGLIEVESELGRGSIFRFAVQLPLHDAPPPSLAVETSSGELDALVPRSGTALVVEDDPVNRLIARAQLESLGMNVIEAADGLEALAKAQVHTVDVVFMDCQMPNLDGYAAARRWREREARLGLHRTPIIALTANAFEEDIQRTRDAGMDAHLSKPYTRAQIKEHLHAWLDGSS